MRVMRKSSLMVTRRPPELDPLARMLEIFRFQDGQWIPVHSLSGEERVRVEPFEAIELELALLWSR
ncbi:hypothetical protein BO221_15385 [Archangium sp. Cb G35]|nr:hypothetical protein BO221_15385 [Archangium sp. Cb G35]